MSRIGAINVKGGVGLSIAQRLCLREHVVEGTPLGAHFSKDKVARAINNACNLGHVVGRHRLAQRLDNRYATGNGGLKPNLHTRGLRESGQFITMLSNQRLICRDNMFALLDRQFDQIVSDRRASNQLNQHVYLWVSSQIHDIPTHTCIAVIMVRVFTTGTNMVHK